MKPRPCAARSCWDVVTSRPRFSICSGTFFFGGTDLVTQRRSRARDQPKHWNARAAPRLQHLVALVAYKVVANAENNPRFASLINRAAMARHNASHLRD